MAFARSLKYITSCKHQPGMEMLPRQDHITQDQIQAVLNEHSISEDSFLVTSQKVRSSYSFSEEPDGYEEWYNFLTSVHADLVNKAQEPSQHASQINQIVSRLIQCNFARSMLPQDIVSKTQHLLQRLPVYSLSLPTRQPIFDPDYYQELSDDEYCNEWCTLAVNNACSLNIVLIAIYINTCPTDIRGIRDYLTLLEQLLSLVSQQESRSHTGFILRAVLWTSWQRVHMLYLFAIIGNELRPVQGSLIGGEIVSRDFQIGERLPVQRLITINLTWGPKPDNLCSWAFEILLREQCCVGSDIRRFLERLNSAWDLQQGRCRNEQGNLSPCPGRSCQRLSGVRVIDQSAHDEGCDANCNRLFWDKTSYLRVRTTRAVSLTQTRNNRIQYCSASRRSLAISHVWGHGQGGRPEDGINECLHKRYTQIAVQYGCDSYWWDSACIPESHQLRQEAIRGINWVFANSKVVLACDQDIMNMDISDCPIWKKESILAMVLVSDWNVRAWTCLESTRGRDHLYLLCKHNACINLLDLVNDIWNEGGVDIAILSLAAHHMLPWDIRTSSSTGNETTSLELAGFMLDHRPASRRGDDFIIWSLMIGLDKDGSLRWPFKDEKQDSQEFVARFWKTFVHGHIATGFLMSSAPRLSLPGLSWAPLTASCRPLDPYAPIYSYDGTGTSLARITDRGIVGEWMMYEFNVQKVQTLISDAFLPPFMKRLKEICKEFLEDCSKAAMIHPVTEDAKNAVANQLQEGDQRQAESAVPFKEHRCLEYPGYRNENGGIVLAVLGIKAHDSQGIGWIWKGTYLWSDAMNYPCFNLVQNVLIS